MDTTRTHGGPLATLVALLGGTFVGLFGLLFGTILTIAAYLGVYVGVGEPSAATMIVLALVFTQGVGCAGIALLYVKVRPALSRFLRRRLGDRPWIAPERFSISASMPSLRDLLYVVGGYVLALALALAGSIILSQLGPETGTNQAAATGIENPEVLLVLIPASFLIIGPGEELLFRGVVQGRFREVFGPALAILVASSIFAGIHYFALTGGTVTGNLLALGVLLFPSFVFGVTYELTDNIVVPSLIHGAYNATLFGLLYLSLTLDPEQFESAATLATSLF
ncbi:lysostaphin resistance A-like protein [Haloferacaceae archaeon DSL9]